jgi:hypothetical protein
MQGFFSSPVVRAILAFLALILLALAVWFIGPLLAFGELHPLADLEDHSELQRPWHRRRGSLTYPRFSRSPSNYDCLAPYCFGHRVYQ